MSYRIVTMHDFKNTQCWYPSVDWGLPFLLPMNLEDIVKSRYIQRIGLLRRQDRRDYGLIEVGRSAGL